MIYEMSRDIEERLVALNFPLRVTYGERARREKFAGGILVVFERDKGGDAVEATLGAQRNARKNHTRRIAATATVFAKSSEKGAHIGDHERACEQVVDALVIAIDEWAKEAKSDKVDFTSSGYTPRDADDTAGFDSYVEYRLSFKIGRGVYRKDYLGNALPTGVPGSVSNTTRVRYLGHPESENEIGCGE